MQHPPRRMGASVAQEWPAAVPAPSSWHRHDGKLQPGCQLAAPLQVCAAHAQALSDAASTASPSDSTGPDYAGTGLEAPFTGIQVTNGHVSREHPKLLRTRSGYCRPAAAVLDRSIAIYIGMWSVRKRLCFHTACVCKGQVACSCRAWPVRLIAAFSDHL